MTEEIGLVVTINSAVLLISSSRCFNKFLFSILIEEIGWIREKWVKTAFNVDECV